MTTQLFEDGKRHSLLKHALCGAVATFPDRPDAEDCQDCIASMALLPEAHACGHVERQRGCGGCDPGAIDLVIEDGGVWRKPTPDETSIPAAPVEVFEVVERRTGQRAMEHVHLSAMAALDWLEAQPVKYHTLYRVQSVAVYGSPR